MARLLGAGSAGGRDRRKVSRIGLGTVRFGLQSAEAVTIVGAPHPKCGVLGSVEEPVNSPTILRGITVVGLGLSERMLAVALKNAGDYLGLGSATLVPGLCRIQVRSIASQKGDVDGVEASGCPGRGDIELPKAE